MGPMPGSAAAYALSAAALYDFALLGFVTQLIAAPIKAPLLQTLPMVPPWSASAVIFGLLLVLYWIVTEAFLKGRSIGRLVLGLSLRNAQGAPLSGVKCTTRALRKLSTLGLLGANPATPSGYDKAVEAVWFSRLAPPEPQPVEKWVIAFVDAPPTAMGKRQFVGTLFDKSKTGEIRFGTDDKWTGFAIEDPNGAYLLSRQHCIIIRQNGKLYVRDGNELGRLSSHGTFVNDSRLKANEWRVIPENAQVTLGRMQLRIYS
jgi:uncharacterized RDD family membrane protein YckC